MNAQSAATLPDEADAYPGYLRWIILVAVLLGTIMEVLDTSIVNVAIPDMMGNLGATLSQVSWVSTGYIIANVIILPLTGWLSVTLGRRRYLACSLALFTTASFFCGISHSLGELVFFRIMQGAGGAALLSTAQATLMEIFPPNQLGMVQAIFGIGVITGPTVGPALGGWITDNYSWPWIFFINIPIGIIAITMTLVFMKDSRFRNLNPKRVDILGIVFLAIGLGCFQTVLEEGNRDNWLESSFIVRLIVISAIGLILFVIWELRQEAPAVNLRVLKNRGLAAGTLFGAAFGVGLYGSIYMLPVFLQNLRSFTAEQSGFALLPSGIATGFTMVIGGAALSKTVPRNLVFVGSLIFMFSMYSLHLVTLDTGSEHLFWPVVMRGAGMGFLFAPLTLASLAGLKGRDLADGTGLFNLTRQLGGSAGIAYLSTMLDRRAFFHRTMLLDYVNVYAPAAQERYQGMLSYLSANGAPAAVAQRQALALMDKTVQAQASLLAFEDAFLIIAVIFLAALPLLLLFKKGDDGAAGEGAMVH